MYPCDLFDCLSDYKNLNSKGEFLIDLPYVGTIAVDLKSCCQNLNYALFCLTDINKLSEIEKLFETCISEEIMKVAKQKLNKPKTSVHGFLIDPIKQFDYNLKLIFIKGRINIIFQNNTLLLKPSIKFADKINSIIEHNKKYSHLNCICNKKALKRDLFCLNFNNNCDKFSKYCKDQKGKNKSLCDSEIFKDSPFYNFTTKELLFDFEFAFPIQDSKNEKNNCKFILSNLSDNNLNNPNNKENFSFRVQSYNEKNPDLSSFQYNNFPLFDKEYNNQFSIKNNKKYIPFRIPIKENYTIEFVIYTNCCCLASRNSSRLLIKFSLTSTDLDGLSGIVNLKIDFNGNFSINNKIIKGFSYKSGCQYPC